MHGFGDTSPVTPAFITKLWALVDDPHTDHLICWDSSGKSFHIYDQLQFAKEVLPMYFKHGNIASFIRQLNMYGFRKVVRIDTGGLKTERDDMEFQHSDFIRDREDLICKIKRKPPHAGGVKEGESRIQKDDVNRVLSDMQSIKGKQDNMNVKLTDMKRENEALWREVASLRQKHSQQQQIVNKLIQFLVTLVRQKPSTMSSVNRRRPLMINDAVVEGARPTKMPRQYSIEGLNNYSVDMPQTPNPAMHSPLSSSRSGGVTIREVREGSVGSPGSHFEATSPLNVASPLDFGDINIETIPIQTEQTVAEEVAPSTLDEFLMTQNNPTAAQSVPPPFITVPAFTPTSQQQQQPNVLNVPSTRGKRASAAQSIPQSNLQNQVALPMKQVTIPTNQITARQPVVQNSASAATPLINQTKGASQSSGGNQLLGTITIPQNQTVKAGTSQYPVIQLPPGYTLVNSNGTPMAIKQGRKQKNTAADDKNALQQFISGDGASNTGQDLTSFVSDPATSLAVMTNVSPSSSLNISTELNEAINSPKTAQVDELVGSIDTDLDALKDLLASGQYNLDADTLMGLFNPEGPIPATPEHLMNAMDGHPLSGANKEDENEVKIPESTSNELIQYTSPDDFSSLFSEVEAPSSTFHHDNASIFPELEALHTPQMVLSPPAYSKIKQESAPTMEEID